MTTATTAKSTTGLKLVPVAAAALIGLAVIAVTGHVQATTLHDAAHDVRHAVGFPCH
ncbi:MAG: CbtB-domain containing protein [Roseibium sp.]|nr:CbtB-domain containing protein [Roseibium sp.]